MERWIAEDDHLRMITAKTFRYARTSSLEGLLAQARNRHYSTFSLYSEAEFEKACQEFEASVRYQFGDPAEVAWHDQNILLQIGRA